MSRKRLQNRLDKLFADLEQDSPVTSVPGAALPNMVERGGSPLPGWTWDCDDQGCYTFCSSEVMEYLGQDPGTLIGQNFDHYLLDGESVIALKNALKPRQFPVEVELVYRIPPESHLLRVKMHVFAPPTNNGHHLGFQGLTQFWPQTEIPSPNPGT